jgi:two-component system response regulator (stage 0 sporulation protein A)
VEVLCLDAIKVGIADDNQEFCQLLQDYFSTQKEIQIAEIVHNGLDALKIISECRVDVILLDMIMPQMDGLAVLQWLKDHNQKKRPKIIIFSAFDQEKITRSAINLGVDYYILKPFDLEILKQRITELAKDPVESVVINQRKVNKELQIEVIKIMESLKIPAQYKGYAYLHDAILFSVQQPALVKEITKKLYPLIAEQYTTTINRVERAMRFAIETAWNKGDVNILHELFGYCVDDKKGKPTNASFIAKISDKIRLEKKVKIF